jgi:hypothetical protein
MKDDIQGDGIFVLACYSGNFNLVRHVLNIALTEQTLEKFLGSRPNNIIRAQELIVCNVKLFDDNFFWIRSSHEFLNRLPEKYNLERPTDHIEITSVNIVYLTDIFNAALDNGLFLSILGYSVLSPHDYNFKQEVWLWMNCEGSLINPSLPISLSLCKNMLCLMKKMNCGRKIRI